jgi:nucleoside-diphosphate-sugar epimerase
MKVFVAGATGVLGRELVPQLVARGHEVVGMTRSASKLDLVRSLQLIAGLFRPMGGAFPPADRQPRDAVAGAVV